MRTLEAPWEQYWRLWWSTSQFWYGSTCSRSVTSVRLLWQFAYWSSSVTFAFHYSKGRRGLKTHVVMERLIRIMHWYGGQWCAVENTAVDPKDPGASWGISRSDVWSALMIVLCARRRMHRPAPRLWPFFTFKVISCTFRLSNEVLNQIYQAFFFFCSPWKRCRLFLY